MLMIACFTSALTSLSDSVSFITFLFSEWPVIDMERKDCVSDSCWVISKDK